MVVVTIIAVVAALAAPTIGTALANRRTRELSLELVRVVRLGRSTAAGQGRAYMLRIDPGADRVDLYRGTSSRCNPVAGWTAVVGAGCAGNARCAESIVAPQVGDDTYDIAIAGVETPVDLCFEPTGVTRWNTGGATFAENHPAGGYQVSVSRMTDGATSGVVKLVALPLGAEARILR